MADTRLGYRQEYHYKLLDETLKKLSKEALANVSGGASIKSALLTGGLLSMALLGGVGLNSSIANVSGGQPKPTQQGQQQKRKSACHFKPTIKKEEKHTQTYGDDDDDVPQISVEKFLALGEEGLKLSLINEFIGVHPAGELVREYPGVAEKVCEKIEQYQKRKGRTSEALSSYCNEIRSKLEKLNKKKVKFELEKNHKQIDDDDDDILQISVGEFLARKSLNLHLVYGFIETNLDSGLLNNPNIARAICEKIEKYQELRKKPSSILSSFCEKIRPEPKELKQDNNNNYQDDDEDKKKEAPKIIKSGDCSAKGSNVKYMLFDNGIMVIPGKRAMKNYDNVADVPWAGQKENIKKVIIEKGVTSIGQGAFYHCSSLTFIEIPDSVTSIEDWAFSGCRSLTSITIPNGVTEIGGSAFRGCSSLTSVNLGKVKNIEDNAFYGCTKLNSVTFPGTLVPNIGQNVFYDCKNLKEITVTKAYEGENGSDFGGITVVKNKE